jgi:uncharacterized protein YacL
MILYILRGAFILLAASVTSLYVISWQAELAQQQQQIAFSTVALMLGVTLGVTGAIVAIDAWSRRKKLASVSGVFLGLIAGLLAAYALSFVVDLVGVLFAPPESDRGRQEFLDLLQGVKVVIGLITCYIGISLVLQTKDDFRFVIPYVEFAKQVRGQRPTLLDTSVVIDGRILDIVNTRLLQGVLVIPKFVLNELQLIADSGDKLKRARGRRGLEILQKLQETVLVDVVIEDADAEGGNVDQKLVAMAKDNNARIMTNDFNLNKIATLRGVDVINLHDLAKALRPVALPGEALHVKIVKPGEAPGQGVGYLEDGTMVVVENARVAVGRDIELVVTSTIQTSAGRMIFGRYAGDTSDPHGHAETGDADAAPHADEDETHTTPLGPGPRGPRHGGRNPRRH